MSTHHNLNLFGEAGPDHLELAIFRFEDVCVGVQEGMGDFLKTAALDKKPGVEATFRWLRRRGVMVCLITDFKRADFMLLSERLGWDIGDDELIQLVVLEESRKTDAIHRACECAGLRSPRSAMAVVDSPRLLRAARGAGLRLVFGVTNGQRAYHELAVEQCRALLDGVIQLPNFLLNELPVTEQRTTGGRSVPPRLRLPG